MNIALAGAIASALAVASLALIPFGSASVFGSFLIHPEHRALREAGWTRSLLAWESLRACTATFGLALAASAGVLPIGLAGAVAPSIALQLIASRKRGLRARQTLPLLQMTLAGLRSGASLTEAVRLAAASEPELAIGPFAAAIRAFDLGAPLDVALRSVRASAHDHRVLLGIDALILCVAEQIPTSRCATLIASVVDRLVFEQRTADEVRARTSGLRAQIVLLAALVPGLAFYLAITVPGMGETLTAPLGRFVLVPLATLLEIAGILASRRIVGDIR